jgi:PAS domain S-box-containing protein
VGKKPSYKELEKRVRELEKNATKYKSVEEALLEKERFISDVFNSIQDGISILNNDLTIRRVNDVMNKWYEKNLPLEGKKCHLCYHNSDKPCNPCPSIRCIKSGQTEREIVSGLSGSSVEWIELFSYPIKDQHSGEVNGVVEFVRDITERTQAEKALAASEERFRDLANSLPQVVYEMDINGVITFANRNAFELFGYTQDDFDKGVTALQMLIPEDREKALKNIQRRLNGEEFGSDEYTALRKDGGTFPISVHGVRVIRDNTPIGLRGIMIDITDQKQSEKEKKKLEIQLQQAQKLESIGTLAGGIAHDFNNILYSIIGYTELALYDTGKRTQLHDNLQEVLIAAQRAKDLVKQILTFSRQVDREPKPIKIQLIVQEALKLIRSSLPSTIEINQNIDNSCGLVMADATQIHQVAMNLLTNAYHAMEDQGGKLDVTLKEADLGVDDLKDLTMRNGSYVCLIVEDTGTGINKHVMDRIFEPYFSTKKKNKGTGLGLAMVHGIVESYGGKIKVFSEPGKGSSFNVYFPVIQTHAEKKETQIISQVEGGTERILLVDDELQIVRMEQQMLERLGYQVTVRTSSIEALEVFRSAPDKFDLIITDMTMPNMTGVELAKKITEIKPDIPMIICTGFSEKISEQKANTMGIRGYAMKPVIKRELAKKIKEVLYQN